MAVLLATAGQTSAGATDDEFDPAFFSGGGITPAITARFSRASVVLDGEYSVTIRMNGERIQDAVVRFAGGTEQDNAVPCLSDAMLLSYGIRADALLPATPDDTTNGIATEHDCIALQDRIADASATFDLTRQVLDLSVPQASMSRSARGSVLLNELDPGITAAMLNYRALSYSSRTPTGRSTTHYLGLQTGLNLGHWNLRHTGSYRVTDQVRNYEAVSTYAERAMPSLGARVVIGDHYTSGSQLDSFRIRGASWLSDQRMLPDSMSGYAPIVRGVAETNAVVRVKQRGITLVEMTVAPGAFIVDDLNPTGQGGDLDVEIVESDGRIRHFTVPNASTPELLREGQRRYSVTMGRFNEVLVPHQPWLAQASLARGLTDSLTGYGAGAVADGYRSVQLGMAHNTRIGAVSFDVTRAEAHLGPHDVHAGYQLHARYSRNFAARGAALTLGMFRYSTEGYFGMSDAFRTKEALRHSNTGSAPSRVRGRLEASFSKTLGRSGSVNVSGASQDYWGERPRTTSLSAGYNTLVGRMTLGANAMRSTVQTLGVAHHDTSLHLGLSMPLGIAPRAPMGSLATEFRHNGAATQRAGLTGRFGEEHPTSYAASLSRGSGRHTQLNLSAQHNTGVAELNASATYDRNFSSTSLGVNGGIVAHRDGLTFAPPLGETIALVSAPGAQGARVGYGNARIGRSGFAVVPYLTPYRRNTVSVDAAGASLGVQFNDTSARVAPIAGATVRVPFDSRAGQATLIETQGQEGLYPPFGAEVLDADGRPTGLVGQNGRIFIHGSEPLSILTVSWGDTEDTQCRIVVPAINPLSPARAYAVVSAPCTREQAPLQAHPAAHASQDSTTTPAPRTSRADQAAHAARAHRGDTI